jgi:hypothetical protein
LADGESLPQRRIVRWILAALLLAGVPLLIVQYARGRIAEYDRWKTTGFSSYQFHKGSNCFFQLRDTDGSVVCEKLIVFDSRFARVLPVTQPDIVPAEWLNDCRNQIEGLRKSRNLDNPQNLDQSICHVKDGNIYYGATPAHWLTKVLHFPERTALLFTSGGSHDLRTMESERWEFVFPAFGGMVVGVEMFRSADGKLTCDFRKFRTLREAHDALDERYSYTNFAVVENRLGIWVGKP